MALTDENGIGATMLVSPTNAGYPVSQGMGFGDNNGWWLILLIILLAAGGWNNGFGGGYGNQPFVINDGNNGAVQRGFDQSAIMSGLGDINAGIFGIQNSLCNGFAGVNQTVSNGFATAEIANNSRQMANMNQIYGLSTQLAQCCCDNRLATAQTQALVQSENCADRAALSDGIRDIITNQTANTQKILDTLCQDKIDAKNEKIAELQNQLTMANLAASQTAQTSRILADNAAQTVALEQYLNPVPVPAYVVQNPNCCSSGCGCNTGCGNF